MLHGVHRTASQPAVTGSLAGPGATAFPGDDPDGGEPLDEHPACYCSGTLIRTDKGDVPVQRLQIGDRVSTLSGRAEPIRWIGRRSYGVRFLRPALRPIVFRAGSLAEGLPRRDLRVSAKHAMLMGGILVPAEALLNNATITRDRACRRVDYVHIELMQHHVVWAEGVPSESYIDDDNRSMFQNADEYARLYPGPHAFKGYCAPRVEGGYLLDIIRRGLVERTVALLSGEHDVSA